MTLNEEWEDIVDLATAMVQIIRDNELVREGYVNWDEVEEYMHVFYTASFTEEQFTEAIALILEATEKIESSSFESTDIPPGTTIH